MNNERTLEKLKKLEGENFTIPKVIESFVGNTEYIEIEETPYRSSFEGYGECTSYICYENVEDSMIFELWLAEDGTIVKVDKY